MLVMYFATLLVAAGQASAGMSFLSSRKPSEVAASNPVPQERKVSLVNAMDRVQQTLESVEQMPTCKKLAAKDLLHSCESFEDRRSGQQGSGDDFLESYQQLFAIRMTNCEQQAANDALPDICQPLLDPDLPCSSPRQPIKNCLEALNTGSSNQWTTFNRVKTDALIMCHAIRVQADKDDIIHLHKILASALTDVNGAIILQKDEMEALSNSFWGITNQMRDFHTTLIQGQQETMAAVKGLSLEVTGTMMDLNDHAQELLRTFTNAKSQFHSAIQLVNVRRDETEAQWAAMADEQLNHVDLIASQYAFAFQQALDTFYGHALNFTRSAEIANGLTSDLANKIGDLSTGMDFSLEKLTMVNSGTDELVTKHQVLNQTTNEIQESLQATRKLLGPIMECLESLSTFLFGFLSGMGSVSLYFVTIFPVAFFCMWRLVSLRAAPFLAASIALYLSIVFAWVHSPVAFAMFVVDQHPAFFYPAYWSMLTVGGVFVILWEGVKQIYLYFSTNAVEMEEAYEKV